MLMRPDSPSGSRQSRAWGLVLAACALCAAAPLASVTSAALFAPPAAVPRPLVTAALRPGPPLRAPPHTHRRASILGATNPDTPPSGPAPSPTLASRALNTAAWLLCGALSAGLAGLLWSRQHPLEGSGPDTAAGPGHLQFGAFVISLGRVRTTGPPAFWRPSPVDGSEWSDPQVDPTLPTLYYLPGIDGTGVAAQQQLPELAQHFNFWSLTVPVEDRTTFPELVDFVVGFVEAQSAQQDAEGPRRPVYLLGESFGGALALAVAARCRRVNRVVLVNPSTSFVRTVWPTAVPLMAQTPEPVYPLVALLMGPVLANPLALALTAVDGNADPLTRLRQLGGRILESIPALRSLAEILPPATLEHKLQLLKDSCAMLTDDYLQNVSARVLAFGSEQDLLLPSAQEVRRLGRRLPVAQSRVIPGRSHALLQEAGVDLMALLQEEGFYTRELRLTGKWGSPMTIEKPTPKEVERTASRLGIQLVESLVSPVFMSVDAEGRVRRGFKGVDWGRRPILLVGNHQTLAPDLGVLVKQLLQEEDVLVRGLSHPAVTGYAGSSRRRRTDDDGAGPQAIGSTFRSFGAVTVGGRNLYDLLANNEVALLYPGGVQEAYKQKGEEYRLMWPDKAEFVRIAARFGATIVPLSAVGADDSIEVVLDGNELQQLPVIGDLVRRRAEEVPSARPGAAEKFVSPLVLPKVTETRRFYYLFGQPIYTDCAMSRERCAEIYLETKDSIAAGIKWLLQRRLEDPYQFIMPRAVYETAWGKQAPTFPNLEGAVVPWAGLTRNTEPRPAPAVCTLDDSVLAEAEAEAEEAEGAEDPAGPQEQSVTTATASDTPRKPPVPGEVQYPDWYPEDC
eukprot:EG_transcript_2327